MSNFFSTNNPTTSPERRLSARTHAAAGAAALVAVGTSNAVLTQLYEASEHPVDYATGQTSFSGQQIKDWYGAMQQSGTLDTYWATQLFDFVFIASVFAFGALAATAIARFNRRGRGAALWASAALACGAIFDVLENLISFAMLANPQGFPDWVALPYSAMAVAKFALIATGVILLALSLLQGLLRTAGSAIARRSNWRSGDRSWPWTDWSGARILRG